MKKKYKTHSAEELLSMSKDEVIKEYNRAVERHNKRITRARKRGITPAATGRRRSRLSKRTKISKQEMIRRMQEMEAGSNITVEGMINDIARMYGNESAEFKAALRDLLDKNPGLFSSIYEKYRQIMEKQRTGVLPDWRSVYYETLSVAVDTQEVKSFSPVDRKNTIWGIQTDANREAIEERYIDMIGERLNKALERILKL